MIMVEECGPGAVGPVVWSLWTGRKMPLEFLPARSQHLSTLRQAFAPAVCNFSFPTHPHLLSVFGLGLVCLFFLYFSYFPYVILATALHCSDWGGLVLSYPVQCRLRGECVCMIIINPVLNRNLRFNRDRISCCFMLWSMSNPAKRYFSLYLSPE